MIYRKRNIVHFQTAEKSFLPPLMHIAQNYKIPDKLRILCAYLHMKGNPAQSCA